MSDDSRMDAVERARRLNLLLDTIPVQGSRATFAMVQAFLADRGVSLSQARWTYLVKADRPYERLNGEQELMTGVAAFFGIDPAYLLDKSGPIPDALEQQLELVRQVRMREVRVYATRKLGNVSPETLEELNRILRDADGPDAGGGEPQSGPVE